MNESDFDSYVTSPERLKNLIDRLPDDGMIKIDISKRYSDGRVRHSLEKINGFRFQGKLLIIDVSTNTF